MTNTFERFLTDIQVSMGLSSDQTASGLEAGTGDSGTTGKASQGS